MQVKTRAIVLSVIKFQEKSLIVKCFTEHYGVKTYMVRNAFSSKNKSQNRALFMPLHILELEANHKNKGGIEYFKEVKIAYPFKTISTDIVKGCLVMFLSETIHNLLHEETENPALFAFLFQSILWLDNHEQVSNYHLIVLYRMTYFLGITPEDREDHLLFFDLKEGCFLDSPSHFTVGKEESLLFDKLMQLEIDQSKGVFTSNEKYKVLNVLLKYFELHIETFRQPKSLEVLKTIFG